jgi:hypothetical protein
VGEVVWRLKAFTLLLREKRLMVALTKLDPEASIADVIRVFSGRPLRNAEEADSYSSGGIAASAQKRPAKGLVPSIERRISRRSVDPLVTFDDQSKVKARVLCMTQGRVGKGEDWQRALRGKFPREERTRDSSSLFLHLLFDLVYYKMIIPSRTYFYSPAFPPPPNSPLPNPNPRPAS